MCSTPSPKYEDYVIKKVTEGAENIFMAVKNNISWII